MQIFSSTTKIDKHNDMFALKVEKKNIRMKWAN